MGTEDLTPYARCEDMTGVSYLQYSDFCPDVSVYSVSRSTRLVAGHLGSIQVSEDRPSYSSP